MQYKKTGPSYFVYQQGKELIISIVNLQSEKGAAGMILLHDAATGQLLKQKQIAAAPVDHEQVLGKLANTIWVFTDSLQGYDAFSLEPVSGESDIAAVNPFMQNNFGRYANAYMIDEAAGVMYIQTTRDQRWKLYPNNFLMKPDDTQSDPAGDDNYSYEFAAGYTVNNRYNLSYALTNVDTAAGLLYILGSEKEISQAISFYGSSIYTERDEERQVAVMPLSSAGRNDPGKMQPVLSVDKYLKGGFLRKKFYPQAWHGRNGERIILYKKNDKLSVAMIQVNGKKAWHSDTTGFANNFIDYLVSDKTLVLWFEGKKDSMLVINLQSGNVTAF